MSASSYWRDVETRRKAIGLSRAEMCRRAGISESTVFKGLKRQTAPTRAVRRIVELILTAAKVTGETADRDDL